MGPYLKIKNTTSKIMKRLLISLVPIIIFAMYKNYDKNNIFTLLYPLLFILLSSITTFLIELIYYRVFYKLKNKLLLNKVIESYAFFPGLFLSLVIPINTPIPILIIGCIFASIVGKLIYGGFGNNIFNPALIGYLFIFICFGSILSSSYIDTKTKATPLTNLSITESISYDNVVKPYGSILDLLFGNIQGTIGEVCKILIIISLIYLILTKTIKTRIPISYILTVFIITSLIALVNGQGIWYPLFHILSGGLLFGAVFMATDPVTTPLTKNGQVIFGIGLGILTVVFRLFTVNKEGVMLSILIMNMLVYIIDKIGSSKKCSIVCIIILCLIGSIVGIISKKEEKKDESFNIISKTKKDNKFVYIVTQIGNGGNIKAEIVFDNNKISSIKVLEHNETKAYYKKVEAANFINKLLNNQDNLNEVDTITGATISSKALKNMVINTLQDYSKNGKEEVINEEKDVVITDVAVFENYKIYSIDTNTYAGTMKLHIRVENKKIVNVEVLEYNDTCYSKDNTTSYYECPSYVSDTNYIENLINNQNNIEQLDTISGATITTKGIKKALQKVLENEKYTSKLEEMMGD